MVSHDKVKVVKTRNEDLSDCLTINRPYCWFEQKGGIPHERKRKGILGNSETGSFLSSLMLGKTLADIKKEALSLV